MDTGDYCTAVHASATITVTDRAGNITDARPPRSPGELCGAPASPAGTVLSLH